MSDDFTETDEEVDELLANYLVERESVDSQAQLTTIRQRLISSNPEYAADLEEYFAGEDGLHRELRGIPTRLADFDDFEDITILGHGGMGVVYRAHQKSLKRVVAIKMSLPGTGARMAGRFRAEAERMAKLSHPNIVPVYEVKQHAEQVFFTMKFLSGGTAEERLDEFIGDPRRAAELLVTVARAVHFAHQHQTLHRDLKPSNVMLDESGRPFVTDFGLGKELTDDDEAAALANPSRTGRVGTPYYMSPEQADAGAVNTATDVYGLGALLYVLLTGKPPIERRADEDDLDEARDRGAIPIRQRNANVDRDLEAICLRCLAREPEDRWTSADALATALEQWLAGRQSVRPWSLPERMWRWARRQPVTALLMVLVIILLAGADAWVAKNGFDARTRRANDSNINVAHSVAATERERLRLLRLVLMTAANAPALRDVLAKGTISAGDVEWLEHWIRTVPAQLLAPSGISPVHSWFLLDAKGDYLARSGRGAPERSPKKNYEWRDYVRGAKSLYSGTYVSRVYSANEGEAVDKFGISTAIRINGTVRAVLVASVPTATTKGSLLPRKSKQIAALVGLKDRTGPTEPLLNQDVIIAHPHVGHAAKEVNNLALKAMRISEYPGALVSNAYDDPLLGGVWVAAFVPVEETTFIVVVQQKKKSAIGSQGGAGTALLRWGGGVLFVCLFLFGSMLWHRRRLATRPVT